MNPWVAALGRWAATALIVAAAIAVAIGLWRHYETDPWTRDGHVRADVVRIAPDVGGLVTAVAVRDNQVVHQGQLLFVVDRPRYADALAEANAKLASARAVLAQARRVARRDLALGDLVATETHEENEAQVATAAASLAQAEAAGRSAVLDLARTAIHAPVGGQVTNLDLHPGDFVAAGHQAMALLDAGSIRVEGYFEETKLHAIRVGQPARVRLMGDPQAMIGHVESIAGGIADDQSRETGNLLPAVQPTFSWVRLAQRIPVRIHIDRMPAGTLLIPGRTATITIVPERRAP